MHRTTCKLSALWWGLLSALLAGGLPAASQAQIPGTSGSALIVPINGTVKVQMSTRKPIRTVTNQKEAVISIRTIPGDPTAVLITGQQPDVTRVELEDVDGKKDNYEVIVQLDIEYLRTQLRRAVPTANITPIPSSNNTVILTGTVTRAADVDVVMRVAQSVAGVQVINAMNVGGVQQVQLDVVVAAVSRSEFRRMSFNFLADSKNFFFGSTVGNAVGQPNLVGVGSATLTTNGTLAGTPGSPNGGPTNILFGVLHNSWGFLGFLQALRDEAVLKLIAEPHLMTLSGRPASFLSGGEQAVPVPAGLGQIGVQFEEFGTRLNFLPIVLGNGRIHLEVEPEVSDLNPANGVSIGGTTVPGRNTSRVNTTVELESGQTFVIGGLIEHRVRASAEKIPILGDVPFLNTMFSSKGYEEIEDELIIMVTPHLVDAQDCEQLTKMLPGQETRTPDDFELFLEGILEAPRGPREVCHGHHYVPAFKNSPSTEVFPCGGCGGLIGPSCGKGSCGGSCGAGCGTGCGSVAAPAQAAAPRLAAPPAAVEVPLTPPPVVEAPPARPAEATPVKAEEPSAPAPAAEDGKPTSQPVTPPAPAGESP